MLHAPPQFAEPPLPPRKKWSREECQALDRAGVVDLQRYELIEGELLRKMSKNLPHMRALRLLLTWLEDLFGSNSVMPESSIDVSPEDNPTSWPEPDVIVLTCSVRDLDDRVRPDQIRLVAEISDSTLAFDLDVKSRLYARAGIPEYWVLDIKGRRLIVHRKPVEGQYCSIAAYASEEFVASLAAPSSSIRVVDLLD